jgi:polyisoprenoid-binding protein YceI
MIRSLSRVGVIAALLFSLVPAARAATWEIDAAHSNVGFVVKHLVIAKVRGNFKSYSGTIVVDEKDPSKSKVDVKIDPASIDTDNGKRDDHLRSADFFDVAKFKDMSFKSTKVERLPDGKLKITGDLTLHGVTKSVVLDAEGPSPELKDPVGNPHIAFSATTTIKRADFGLLWNKAIEGGSVVGEDVKVEIDLELFNKKP